MKKDRKTVEGRQPWIKPVQGPSIQQYNNTAMNQGNTGWLFYRNYYEGINFRAKEDDKGNAKRFDDKNKALYNAKFRQELVSAFVRTDQSLQFETTYPGLLIGSGYNHETGFLGEIKIGFHFDHTTGMPYLPGSSVKGTLRAAFDHWGYIEHLLGHSLKIPQSRIAGLEQKAVIKETFEGNNKQNMYDHDVFHDAIVTRGNAQGRFLGPDFITPHERPGLLHNPVPIQFLKVLPGVELTFYFELKDGLLTAAEKLKLFQQIIKDTGVGAKTNVGYGWLKQV